MKTLCLKVTEEVFPYKHYPQQLPLLDILAFI